MALNVWSTLNRKTSVCVVCVCVKLLREIQSVWERELVKTTVDSQLRASYRIPYPRLFLAHLLLFPPPALRPFQSHVTLRRFPPNRDTQVLVSGAPSNRLLGSLMLNYHFFP
jgi:hypothetical protein